MNPAATAIEIALQINGEAALILCQNLI